MHMIALVNKRTH